VVRPTYEITFTVHGATLAEIEETAAAKLAEFAQRDAAEFKVTYQCSTTMLSGDGEFVLWHAEVTAISSPGTRTGPPILRGK
jgi:hypothetical protein